MLPTSTGSGRPRHATKPPVMWHSLRRLLKPRQMDFQYTFWTMLQLLVSPKTAYRQTSYHKQTKNLWARDDPAFVVVSSGVVAAVSLVYGLIFSPTLARTLSVVASAVLVDYLSLGCAIATASCAASDQSVEWGYAYDVHCNAFWPLFLLLGVVQLLLCPVLLLDSWFAAALSSCLYAAALCHYLYIVFLGYNALPFLDRTEAFLYPAAPVVAALAVSLLLGFNPTKTESPTDLRLPAVALMQLVLRIYYGRA